VAPLFAGKIIVVGYVLAVALLFGTVGKKYQLSHCPLPTSDLPHQINVFVY
jgi:hypothetical protein